MSMRAFLVACLASAGACSAPGQSYGVTDLVVGFQTAGSTNDLQMNLGPVSALPKSGSEDFGNVNTLLSSAGLSLSSSYWSVAAQLGGSNGGPTTVISGTPYLPDAFWLTQSGTSAPSAISFNGAVGANNLISEVGLDPYTNAYKALGGSALGNVAFVVPTADMVSYASIAPYGLTVGFSPIETLGVGTASFWAFNSVTPGTSSKGGVQQGNLQPTLLGSFAVTSSGDLVYSASAGSGPPTPTPTPTPAPGGSSAATRLVNISSRAEVDTGANIAIAGFVVSGPAGSTEQVLVRAVGPSLAQFGVSGVLEQPVLTLYDASNTVVATNAGWSTASNAAEVAAAAAASGAFTLGSGSADSALLLSLAPGPYTAQVSGSAGSTGVALAEVYEVAAGSAQLVNISTRAFVGTGANVEIGGFNVSGSQPATVLIRAVGPALGQFGVEGFLAQPTLQVVNSATQAVVSTNTGWSGNANAAQIASVSQSVGAFALPSGSADCALLLTLQPGAYTAIVSGTGGTSGVALVEVYLSP